VAALRWHAPGQGVALVLQIRMRGDIDALVANGTFDNFVNSVNLAAAAGRQYVILEDLNGNPMALNQSNILTIQEIEDVGGGLV
jgi:hypothetical protein